MAVAVGIGLTNECNLACPHCYRPTLALQRLTLAQVEDYIGAVAANGALRPVTVQ